jgi:long-chain acyl-CoA synthetase
MTGEMTGETTQPGVWLGESFRSTSEIRSRAAALAAALGGLEAGPERTIVLVARNSFLPIEVTLAAATARMRVVPANPKATPAEVAFLLADSGARVLVGHADLVRGLRSVIGPDVRVVSEATPPEVAAAFGIDAAAAAVEEGDLELEGLLRSAADGATRAAPDASLSSLFYTSGTTGKPKGVLRPASTAEEVAKRQRVLETCYGLDAGSVGLVTTPLCHMFSSNFAQTALRVGGSLVVMPKFDAAGMLRVVERHGVTNLQVVPTMFVRLLALAADERAAHDIGTVRHVLHTGAPCPQHVKRAMIDWWGPVIWEQYGATETGVVALCDSAEWLAHPGTVGRPFHGSLIRIDDDEGRPCAPGEVGSVYAVMPGTPGFTYLGRPEARGEVERDGLVTAGDVGCLDEDGYLHLRDRRVDLILNGGLNVYPAEVESEILAHPLVADCAVVGVPDAEYGERVAALVAFEPGAPADAVEQLRASLRGALSAYKVPREYQVVDAVPRDDSGKLLRRLARQQFPAMEASA